ncbi:MAG: CFI-box-CTERM domain-containing protein [Bacteroidota bacterium]
MNNSSNYFELAKIALEGENYKEAYEKFTKVIEEDFNNIDAWIGKGMSATYSSEVNSIRFKEAKTCLDKAIELGTEKINYDEICEKLLVASKLFIKKVNSSVATTLMHKENKPMGTFQLYAVKKVGDIADRYKVFNEHWQYYEDTIEFMNYISKINPSLSVFKNKLSIIDFIYSETEGHFHKDILSKLKAYRNKTIDAIRQLDESYTTTPTPKKPDGCFIATVVYGTYDHNSVLVLRSFRDQKLKGTKLGEFIINFYYSLSPGVSLVLKNKHKINNLIRTLLLDKIVKLSKKYL